MWASVSAVNLWRNLLLCCWHIAGRNNWTRISVLGIILCSEFLFKSLTWVTYKNDLCGMALLSMVCASRCTNAISSTQGRSGFAAVERGKHHLHTAVWYTPFLLCPSEVTPHSPVILLHGVQVLLLPVLLLLYISYPDISEEVKHLIFQIFWAVAPGGCWGSVLRCRSRKRLGSMETYVWEQLSFNCPWPGSHCLWKQHSASSGIFIVCTQYAVIVSIHPILPLASSVLHKGLGYCI